MEVSTSGVIALQGTKAHVSLTLVGILSRVRSSMSFFLKTIQVCANPENHRILIGNPLEMFKSFYFNLNQSQNMWVACWNLYGVEP